MNQKQSFLRGTLLLTLTSILSRCMGFFYRIFLANQIGAEGLGIYQLIFPIYTICHSLSSSGIETAISKYTAAKYAAGKPLEARNLFRTGLVLSLFLSLCSSFFIYHYADFLAFYFLKDLRCIQLLKILSFTIPFGSLQCCFCGFYYGLQKTVVPSFSILIEQSFRILGVYFLCMLFKRNHWILDPMIPVIGLVMGESISLLFTIICFYFSHAPQKWNLLSKDTLMPLAEISVIAIPLTANRVITNLLISLEAVLIPISLKNLGMSHSQALSIYGILNGMALPFILLPNTISGSLSVMLLPSVSKSYECGQMESLKKILQKSLGFCALLGIFSGIFFFYAGNFIGNFFFSNLLAGQLIAAFAWLCPFLYLNTTLGSVLNGLGLTKESFWINISCLALRIIFVCFCIPAVGLKGYLWGLFFSMLLQCFFSFHIIRKSFH